MRCGEEGFTLLELLLVISILVLSLSAVSSFFNSSSTGTELKTAALLTASRLRDSRVAAMNSHSERVVHLDMKTRQIRFGDGRAALELKRIIDVEVVAADDERQSATTAGIRFYPNGSSSGATITLNAKGQAYEIRVNWLTGRVSTGMVR